MDEVHDSKNKRPSPFKKGPMGYGDPEDKTLRKTEKDIIIPKMIREEASNKCSKSLKKLLECIKQEGILCSLKCREEKNIYNDCLTKWATNSVFVKEMTDKYLEARSYYRQTGKPLIKYERIKKKKLEVESS